MSPLTGATVVARRRRDRRALIAAAEEFEGRIPAELGVLGIVVFGSVARGDHHTDSDVDVLVIAEHLPDDHRDRLRALGWPPPPRVHPLAWTPAEWHHRLTRADPIATESTTNGLWLRGALDRSALQPRTSGG